MNREKLLKYIMDADFFLYGYNAGFLNDKQHITPTNLVVPSLNLVCPASSR